MKVNDFVKKHGWNSLLIAKTLPKFNRYKYVIFYADEIDFSNEFHAGRKNYMFDVAEVKRLVESYGLVESRGGLDAAKHELILLQKHLNNTFGYVAIITSEKIENLKQAVSDVESCMEVKSEN